MAKGRLGIEIGNSRVKIVEMKNDEIVNFAALDLPANVVRNEEIISWDGMRDFLKTAVKENHFTAKQVYLALPDNAVYLRRLTLPLMTEKQLTVNLPYEFHDFVTGDKEQYLYDYMVLDRIKHDNGPEELELIGVAISKELMNSYQTMFHDAGLKLVQAAPQSITYSSLMKHADEEKAKEDFAILDVGYAATRVTIYAKGQYYTSRDIERGCEYLASKVADLLHVDDHIACLYLVGDNQGVMDRPELTDACGDIAVDVMRAINYYTYENRDNNLETLYVCGGGEEIPQLLNAIRETVPLNLVSLRTLSEGIVKDPRAMAACPSAIGMCWNGEDD